MPLFGAKLRLEANGALPVREISNPAGALIVIFAVRAVPFTVKDCEVEALPSLAVKLPRRAGEAVNPGVVLTLGTIIDGFIAPLLLKPSTVSLVKYAK